MQAIRELPNTKRNRLNDAELVLFVSRGLGGLGALEQHVAGAVAPARGAGEDLAVGEARVADDFFPRIVGRRLDTSSKKSRFREARVRSPVRPSSRRRLRTAWRTTLS